MLIENTSDVIFCVNEKGVYQFVNKVFAATFGKTPDYFFGKTFWDVYPKEHADYRFATTKRVFLTGESESIEVAVPLPDKTLYFYATASPIKDEAGQVILIMTHAVDITDLKLAQDEREKSLTILKDTGAIAKVGRWELDLTTGITRWTDEAYRIFEIDLTGDTPPLLPEVVSCYTPEYRPVIAQAVQRAIDYGEPYDLELKLITKKGNSRWVHTNGKAIWVNGKIKRMSGAIQDITERKQAEEREKELREKLERAARMESLGVLAGGVAHDLNNVLGPIVILPDMIAEYIERCGNPVDPEHTDSMESIQAIKAAALRATAMVGDLVVLGRRGQFQQVQVDVNKVVEQMLDSKQIKALQARRPDVKVLKMLSLGPLWCMGSDSRLARVLANLVGNAAEAIDGTGDVSVRTSRHVLTELRHGYEDIPAGDYVTIEVTDTGCGMNDQTISRIFEPFFSMKAPSERSGSGLGLSVVRGLVKDHAGFLDVQSVPGNGTTFTVYLPSATVIEVEAVTDGDNLPGGHERILVVDDEPGQQFLAQRALKKLGYIATVVSSGEEAVALFAAAKRDGKPIDGAQGRFEPFDLVMMDMIMKGMDGLAACKAILKLFPKQKMIIASGHAPDDMAAEVKALAIGWIAKPYLAVDLACVVRATLDR